MDSPKGHAFCFGGLDELLDICHREGQLDGGRAEPEAFGGLMNQYLGAVVSG